MKTHLLFALFVLLTISPSLATADSTPTTQTYSEGGSSGSGLFAATRQVMPIKVTVPAHPEFVDMAKLGYDKFQGHLVIQNLKSRFAVFMWQEDAQGNKMGILDSGATELPGPWRKSIGDRFWPGKWSEDIVAISWSPDGSEMIVENGDVFNDSGIYWLDLMSRKATLLGAGEMGKIEWAKRQVTIGTSSVKIPAAAARGTFSREP